MFQEFLHQMGAHGNAEPILIFFTVFFVTMVAWVLRPRGAVVYSKIAQLPLDEEERHV